MDRTMKLKGRSVDHDRRRTDGNRRDHGRRGKQDRRIDDQYFHKAAGFNAVSIRNTSRRLGLSTEAAMHFTKGVEPMAPIKAVDRSVQLLKELAEADGF